MTRIVIAFCAILFISALVAAQQQTPAPVAPAQPGVPSGYPAPPMGQQTPAPGVPMQPGVPPGHPMPTMGQQTPRAPHPAMPDPLHDVMFPPGMILDHARQLNLTEEQKTFMRAEISKTTVNFQDLQWKLQDQMEQLHEMMKASLVNEEQVLAQLNKVLDLEREIKRLHFGLAIRVKNQLTAEQQEQLHKLRTNHPGMPTPPQPTGARSPINPE